MLLWDICAGVLPDLCLARAHGPGTAESACTSKEPDPFVWIDKRPDQMRLDFYGKRYPQPSLASDRYKTMLG